VRERLTRDLNDALTEDPRIAATAAKISYEPINGIESGAKGSAVDLTQLIVTTVGAGSLHLLARQVVAGIQAWCAKDSRRKVRVTHGDITFEIAGKPTRAQLKIIEDSLERLTAAAKNDNHR
jgi:hypothetical protein